MVDAFPQGDVVSLEHDGIVVRSDPDKVLALASQAVGVELAVKQCGDPMKCLEEQFPGYDWSVRCKVSPLDYMKVALLCRRLVEKGPAACRANNYSFAKYVAWQLSGCCNVPHAEGEKRTHFELFVAGKMWRVKHRDDLTSVTMEALEKLVYMPFSQFHVHDEIEIPAPLQDTKFAAALGDSILALLANESQMPSLDGDCTRHKLLFQEGVLYDFRTGVARAAKPDDRCSLCMGCAFRPWQPPAAAQEAAKDLFENIKEYCKGQKERLKDCEFGIKVQDSLRELAKHSGLLKALQSFAMEWEPIIWLLRFITRRGTQSRHVVAQRHVQLRGLYTPD